MRALATLPGLRSLHLSASMIPECVAVFAVLPTLRHLTDLGVVVDGGSHGWLRPEPESAAAAAAPLMRIAECSQLRRLSLGNLPRAVCMRLLRAPGLRQLEWLTLTGVHIDFPPAAAAAGPAGIAIAADRSNGLAHDWAACFLSLRSLCGLHIHCCSEAEHMVDAMADVVATSAPQSAAPSAFASAPAGAGPWSALRELQLCGRAPHMPSEGTLRALLATFPRVERLRLRIPLVSHNGDTLLDGAVFAVRSRLHAQLAELAAAHPGRVIFEGVRGSDDHCDEYQ